MKWLWIWLVIPAVTGCRNPPEPRLSVEAYVWQPADRPEVVRAMNQAKESIKTFHVRAAEFRWTEQTLVAKNFVRKLPRPDCGLVVRIGSSASHLEWTPEQIKPVADLFRQLAAFGPVEIQCDFDCPQKRLGNYEKLLEALQMAAGKVPVLPTALPSWLDEPGFSRLIAGRAGYVLQVHSLQLPEKAGEPVVIFDPRSAELAANKAAALRVPFRIAMATYGCEVRFGDDGKIIDVISEDTGSPAPAGTRREFAYADPVASARLVRKWRAAPPDGMLGIIWYRLPVEGDRRNWPWTTLQHVIRGEDGRTPATLEMTDDNGAMDLFIANHGHFPVRLPAEVIITSKVLSADGAGAYSLSPQEDGIHFTLRSDAWPWLDPDHKIAAGWLRATSESSRIEWKLTP